MKTKYKVQEYRWSENMCDPQIEGIGEFESFEEAEKCYNEFTAKTIGYTLQIEKLTFDEDDDLIDSETVVESGEYTGKILRVQ